MADEHSGFALFKKFAVWVGLPAIITIAAQHLHESAPHFAPAVVPFVEEFAKAAVAIGIGAIFADEIVAKTLIPSLRRTVEEVVLPAFREEMKRVQEVLGQAIGETGSVLRQEIGIRWPVTEPAAQQLGEDPQMGQVKEALLRGSHGEALRLAEELAARDARYEVHVLTILIFSPEPAGRERAFSLLDRVGEPRHFLALAYSFWQASDEARAIAVAERGLQKAEALTTGDREKAVSIFKNSLAYYYADGQKTDKAALARRYADEATVYAQSFETTRVASYLATRGYVKITFETTKVGIEDGVKDCEDARRAGARQDLYFRHLARAQERLRSSAVLP